MATDRPSAPPASARTVTRYMAFVEKRRGLRKPGIGLKVEPKGAVVLYAEVAPLLTALAEIEQRAEDYAMEAVDLTERLIKVEQEITQLKNSTNGRL